MSVRVVGCYSLSRYHKQAVVGAEEVIVDTLCANLIAPTMNRVVSTPQCPVMLIYGRPRI